MNILVCILMLVMRFIILLGRVFMCGMVLMRMFVMLINFCFFFLALLVIFTLPLIGNDIYLIIIN